VATKAEILITARDQTNTAFKSVERSLAGLQTASVGVSSALAALSTAGAVGFARSIINDLDKLGDLSKTTGLAVNQLAGLGFAAKQSGSDLDSVAGAVSKLSVNIGKDADKFRQLGITAKDPLEAFKQMADVLIAIKDPQERAAVANAAFGKSWQEIMPLLLEGGAAIGRMTAEGERASGVTKEMTEAADKLNDQLNFMKTRVVGVATSIVGDFLPAMNSALDKLQKASVSGSIFSFFTASSSEEADAEATIGSLKEKVAALKKTREELTAPTLANKINNTLLGSLLSGGVSDVKTLDNQIFAIEKKIAYLSSLTKKADELQNAGAEGKAPSKSSIATFLGNVDAKAAADRDKSAIQSLRDRLAATQQLTELEKVGNDIREGKYRDISVSGKQQLLILAAQIDSTRDLNQAEKDQAEAQKKATEEGVSRFKALEEAGAAVYEATRTDAQKYADEVIRLNDLLAQGAISQETYNVALQKTQDEYIKAANKASETSDEMSQYAIQAARNMQTSFAQFLFDPFEKGLGGMLTGFLDVMRRMAAEAASRKIFESLFGVTGKSGDQGLLGSVFNSAISSLFGVKKFASGGSFGGGLRLVGESGPELEVTGPSRIYNAADTQRMLGGQGGDTINVNLTIQTGVQQTVRAEVMTMLPAIEKRVLAGVVSAKGRNKFAGALG
jgi:major membrane immunogen (membrane-anchored lipoprotein)